MVDMEKILSEPVGLSDGIEVEDYVIGTYIIEINARMDGLYMGKFAAVEQTTGTWVRVPAETAEVRKNHIAKVIGVYELPFWEYEIPKNVEARQYCLQLAFPVTNLTNPDGSFNFPMMFTALIGNISMGGKLKLVDITFPKRVLAKLPGPNHGIDGVRSMLGVPKRPLLNNMVKPCTGHTAPVAADLIYKAAVGGCDVIKDDELISNAEFNTLEDRISQGMAALDKANEEKGEKTIYTINITDNFPDVLEHANKMVSMGANGLMVNYIVQGTPLLMALRMDNQINKVPLMGHMDFAGVWYEDPWSGISSHLTLGKIPRLCGADILVTPAPYGKAYFVEERFQQVLLDQTYPLANIKPMLPMPSGGITAGLVEKCCQDCGTDILIGSGGGIHAHPDGPIQGAKSFRQAIDAVMEGKTAKEKAKEPGCEALAKSLGTWGSKRTGA